MKVYIVWKKLTVEFDECDDRIEVSVTYPVRELVGVFAREEAARCTVAGVVHPGEKLELEECEVRP